MNYRIIAAIIAKVGLIGCTLLETKTVFRDRIDNMKRLYDLSCRMAYAEYLRAETPSGFRPNIKKGGS